MEERKIEKEKEKERKTRRMGERSFAKARKKHGERAHSSIKKDGPQEDK